MLLASKMMRAKLHLVFRLKILFAGEECVALEDLGSRSCLPEMNVYNQPVQERNLDLDIKS